VIGVVEKKPCPLCGQQLEPEELRFEASSRFDDGWDVQCRMCGKSSVTMEAAHEIRALAVGRRADLASWVCEQALHGRKPPTICSSEYSDTAGSENYRVDQILETLVPRSIAERLERILENLAAMTGEPGELCSIDNHDIYACYAHSPKQMHFYLSALADAKLIRGISDGFAAVEITPSGWARIGELRGAGAKADQAFVAMWFDHELDAAWDEGFYKGVERAGYRPLRVDKEEHNEKICDRIILEIRRSGFVVADVTGQRPGVYFEAGYALGLGIPVIWTCRVDELSKCHFDTRQYNYIVWESPDGLAKALEQRIRATIGEPPK
jgi:hypothetical protein